MNKYFSSLRITKLLLNNHKTANPLLSGVLHVTLSSPSFVGIRLQSSYIHDEGNRLEVKSKRWPHPLHVPHTWLRDHCRCPQCYSDSTNQRIFDVSKMSLDIRPCDVKMEGEMLKVVWPDEHVSEYHLKFLWQNCYEGYTSVLKDTKKTWNTFTFPYKSQITITRDKLLDSVSGVQNLVEIIEKYGLAMVDGVDATLPSTRAVVESIAPVMPTFYGEMWGISASGQHSDTAYTTGALGAHTDNIYFNDGAKLQVFHCFEASEEGGESLLVDGFNVLKTLKNKHPEAYDFFSKHSLSGEYVGDGKHYHSIHKVITHDAVTGALQQFRFNLYDRAPLNTLKLAEVSKYYKHLQTLAQIVKDEKNEVWIKLMPGTVLLIDNWRVMHGRAAYTGNRVVSGCYVARDEYVSKVNTLGL